MYIARGNGNFETQSVKAHSTNVAEYAAAFGFGVGLGSTCFLAGILHDMGKYLPAFQSYIKSALSEDKTAGYRSKPDHARAGALYVYRMPASSASEKIVRDMLSMCIAYHHGGLSDYVSFERFSKLYKRLNSEEASDDATGLSVFLQNCIGTAKLDNMRTLSLREIDALCRKIGLCRLKPHYSFYIVIKFVYSCLIDADRLDAYAFSQHKMPIKPHTIYAYLDRYRKRLFSHLAKLQNRAVGSKQAALIRDLRAGINERCKTAGKTYKTGIYTLTVPVGGGKTFASLNFALEHCAALSGTPEEKQRIIYVLPYTTIIEQNANLVRRVLGCKDELFEHHSAVVFSDEDDESRYKLLTERWDSPIIFTTFVQFLNTLFEGGTQSVRRLHHLANAVIVFDEVQALPLHCTYLFNDALNTLCRLFNTTSILCTATQPDLQNTAVPLLLTEPSELIENPRVQFEQFKRLSLCSKCTLDGAGLSLAELTAFTVELAEEYKSILIIMNTKKGVRDVYRELSSTVFTHRIVYLTTALCPAHRTEVIEDIKKTLENGSPLICVSTNLVECGVDISFETAIRNLAGLPSLVQTGGRVNRHGERESAFLYVTDYPEKTDRMPEIRLGIKCAREMFIDFKNDPSLFEGDLLSCEAMSAYYKKYFAESKIEDKMSYPETIDGIKIRLYDLLNNENDDLKRFANEKGFIFSFPFESTGRVFKVIPDDTVTVLVPYKKGESIISMLFSKELYSMDLHEKYVLLKEMQRFCISMYAYERDELLRRGGLTKVPDFENLYVLAEDEYNEVCGSAGTGLQKLLIT
ncbi:CRISPR-associated helicase Cas3' [Treponema sp. HNW]|uniref:CRISPR-associated helicase Cas3' n=1 Tax=Treponema sp. HNW TaxID=3116654 RepID=UPI003D1401DE